MSHVAELEPFAVGELIVRSLDGFLAVAAANLGETLQDGSAHPAPDPRQAYLALAAVAALLDRFEALMDAEAALPFRAGFLRLNEKLSALAAGPEDWVDRLFASFDED